MDECAYLGAFWDLVSMTNFGGLGGGGGAPPPRYVNAADVEKTSLLSQPLIVHFREAFPSACVCWID
jgi:hypothetical protein